MFEALLAALPPYAEDIKRTLIACTNDETLTPAQKWGAAHAAAEALACGPLNVALETDSPLPPETRSAIRGAAAVMAMNNVYFRAVHLMKNNEYQHMRAGIRMGALAPSPAATQIDIDLWTFAVSAINACGGCMDIHEDSLRKHGGTPAHAHAALKLAASIAGAAAVLNAEQARR